MLDAQGRHLAAIPAESPAVAGTARRRRRRSNPIWISKRTDYATRAVLALAIAGTERPITLEELGERTEVPTTVLSQVMPTLRTAGIVRALRGQHGGYLLNHDPAEVTLEDVVRLFEGQLAPIDCATRKHPDPCPMTVGCSLRHVWEHVRDETIRMLSEHTFADLAADAGGNWVNVAIPTAPRAAGGR